MCNKRHNSCELLSSLEKIFKGSDVVKAAGLAFGSVSREREGERERDMQSKREINKTPPHLHYCSTILHLAEMANSAF